MTLVSKYDYELPESAIAQKPLSVRSDSRLLVVDRRDQSIFEAKFSELPCFFGPGDVMVFNDTKVLNARFFGRRETGGSVEFLFLRTVLRGKTYEVLSKPARKLRSGEKIDLLGPKGSVTVLADLGEGRKLISAAVGGGLLEYLKKYGKVPLPPYIKTRLEDASRYQTKYARLYGSSAAPTAGLHFTRKILGELERKGVRAASVTLDVGLGTFKPMDSENVEDHQIHTEHYTVSDLCAELVNAALDRGAKLVAVGTTSLRALESSAKAGRVNAQSGGTSLFIKPGYKFRTANVLLTNFHLPKTTLFVLATEFGGFDLVYRAYKHALENDFRFLSFGDAMLILR